MLNSPKFRQRLHKQNRSRKIAFEALERRELMTTFAVNFNGGFPPIISAVNDNGEDKHLRIVFGNFNGIDQYAIHDEDLGTDVPMGADISTFTFQGSSGRDFLLGADALSMTAYGNGGDDEIRGGSRVDHLYGGPGNDKLYGGDADDMLYGGARTDSDQLFGELGNDRFYVRSKSSDPNVSPPVNPVKDKKGVDAIIRMVDMDSAKIEYSTSWAANSWTDAEIDKVETAFSLTAGELGNTRWMKQYNGDDFKLYRLGSPADSSKNNIGAWWSGFGNMYYPNATFTSSIPAELTVLHEVAHGYDEQHENPFINEFRALSRWTQNPTGPIDSYSFWKDFYFLFFSDNYIPSSTNNDNWHFWSDSDFTRGYGASSPLEDFSTVTEAYFAPPVGAEGGYTTVQPKFDNLQKLFTELKKPLTPINLAVSKAHSGFPTFTWDARSADSFNIKILDDTKSTVLSTFTRNFDYTTLNALSFGNYTVQVQSVSRDGTLSSFASKDFSVDKVVPFVDTLQDVDDGDLSAGNFSLREAMRIAEQQAEVDLITISPTLTGTITLNGTPLPTITEDLIIKGPGANKLTISGDDKTRIFKIDSQSFAAASVGITGLTLSHGKASTGITDPAQKTLDDDGGAIYNETAFLTLDGVVIRDSFASRTGGGIVNIEGYLTINNSTLLNNKATFGGGMASKRVDQFKPSPTTTGYNTTIVNNLAVGSGGGVFGREGSIQLHHFTIVGNRADSDALNPSSEGGGVYVLDEYFTLNNSIIAGNYIGSGTTTPDDINTGSLIQRITGSKNNLISDAATADFLTNGQDGNIIGVNGTGTRGIYSILKYNSMATAENGTFYFALRPGSPAIDAGSEISYFGAPVPVDVRGQTRNYDGNSDDVNAPDMGAFEAVPPTLSLKVDPSNNFTEHGGPKIIAPSIYPIDPDRSGYANGRLRVFSKAPHNSDRIAIRNQGTAAGKIGISGTNVTFGGVTFGSFSGGTGVTPLVINFSSNASTQMVAALMKSITFQAVGNDIGRSNGGGATRIEFELTDSTGGTSSGAEVVIRVFAINDAPVLSTANPPSLSGVNGATGIAVSALLAGITDPDGATESKGLAIAAADGTFAGKWQYSLDNGTNWVDFGAVSKSAALLLPDLGIASRIRFVRTSGTAPLTIKLGYYAWDQSVGTIGPKEDISQASKHGGSGAYSINFRNSTTTI